MFPDYAAPWLSSHFRALWQVVHLGYSTNSILISPLPSGYADFVCFGYKRGDDGELAVDEPDAAVVRKLFRMKANGSSLREISGWRQLHGLKKYRR